MTQPLDQDARTKEKRESRETDQRLLETGLCDRGELHSENDVFSRISFENFRISSVGRTELPTHIAKAPDPEKTARPRDTVADGDIRHTDIIRILDIIGDLDPIIVGGQSIGLLAEFHAVRHPELFELAPFSSKDVDFFNNPEAAKRLAATLDDGRLFLPGDSDMAGANASLVSGTLNRRPVIIDFMAGVVGVRNRDILERNVRISGNIDGKPTAFRAMNPLDCLRSRIANINVLRRHDEQTVRQARVAIEILKLHLDMLLAAGCIRMVQDALHELQFVIRDHHLSKATHTAFGDILDPLGIMAAFADDVRLDQRWRNLVLKTAILRLKRKFAVGRNPHL